MPGFIRRFSSFPGTEVITQIEGVVIVDLPPPGAVEGVDTGVTAIVGEFADMTFAVAVDGSGNVGSLSRPQEVFSSQDLINQFGGFDETLGDFGVDGGNGFVALRNKRYSRLIVAPVNLSASKGCRFFRFLPLCKSETDVTPVAPIQAATLAAGMEFLNLIGGRARLAARVDFTGHDAFFTATGGVMTNAPAAATQTISVAGVDFTQVERPDGSLGVKKGDIVVVGCDDGTGQSFPTSNLLTSTFGAATYRVAADATLATTLTLEILDGLDFSFTTAANVPIRIHTGSDADSAPVIVLGSSVPGGYLAFDAGGASTPIRPLTNETGGSITGVWSAAQPLLPRGVDVFASFTTDPLWAQPLSFFFGITHPDDGLTFVPALHAPNSPTTSNIDAAYATTFAALTSDQDPISSINIEFSARLSQVIRSSVKANVTAASSLSAGRVSVIGPPLNTVGIATVVGDTDPGVGANRNERVIYTWPGAVTFIPEAVDFRLRTADGNTTTDGILDVRADGFLASILSNLPPERNPAQGAEPVPTVLAPVLGIQRGVQDLVMQDYIVLRQRGVCALRIDRTVGPIFQSGVTTSLISGQKNISRRRMADFIQDSLAQRLVQFTKLPLTTRNKDGAVAEAVAFMEELLSRSNPAAARILAYQVDDKSGNTPGSEAKGIFVIIVRAQLIPSGDFIVLQTEVGENVSILEPAA